MVTYNPQNLEKWTQSRGHQSSLREGFKNKEKGTVPISATPSPPSELGTSLSEILFTVFFKFVELELTDQFNSILVSNT